MNHTKVKTLLTIQDILYDIIEVRSKRKPLMTGRAVPAAEKKNPETSGKVNAATVERPSRKQAAPGTMLH